MKRKVLALTLSAAMILACTPAFASEEHTHGTSDAATVSTETSSDPSTDFYLYVEKDASSSESTTGGVTTDTSVTVEPTTGKNAEGEDTENEEDMVSTYVRYFILNYTDTTKSSLSVTVPLYVCMYGYGATGDVVTPSADSYKLTNSSTISTSTELGSVEVCYKVTKLTADNIESYSSAIGIANANTSGAYGVYLTDKNDAGTVVLISYCSKDDDGEYYYNAGDYTVESAVVTDNDVTWTYSSSGWSTTTNLTTDSDLAVKIPTITATNSWTMVSTSSTDALKAGEIQMTLTAKNEDGRSATVDLAEAEGGLDITSSRWMIAGNDSLGIDVYALIAGDSVNEETCAQVTKVTYTIVKYEGYSAE